MTSLGPVDVVTGAFSYSGAAIARELQSAGHRGANADRPFRPRPRRKPDRRAATELRRSGRTDPLPTPRAHPLQHVLGALRARPHRPRRGRGEQLHAVRGRGTSRRRAHRARVDHAPVTGVPVSSGNWSMPDARPSAATPWSYPYQGRPLTALSHVVRLALRDVLLTGDEYRAMAGGLADSDAPATGTIVLTDWITEHAPISGGTTPTNSTATSEGILVRVTSGTRLSANETDSAGHLNQDGSTISARVIQRSTSADATASGRNPPRFPAAAAVIHSLGDDPST
jgi:hypothetical protein